MIVKKSLETRGLQLCFGNGN